MTIVLGILSNRWWHLMIKAWQAKRQEAINVIIRWKQQACGFCGLLSLAKQMLCDKGLRVKKLSVSSLFEY